MSHLEVPQLLTGRLRQRPEIQAELPVTARASQQQRWKDVTLRVSPPRELRTWKHTDGPDASRDGLSNENCKLKIPIRI